MPAGSALLPSLCAVLLAPGPDVAEEVASRLAAGASVETTCTVTRSAEVRARAVNSPLLWLLIPPVPALLLATGATETDTWTVDVPPLALAVGLVDGRPTEALLAAGASPLATDSQGVAVLSYAVAAAVRLHTSQRVERLIGLGADATTPRLVWPDAIPSVLAEPILASRLRERGWDPCAARDGAGMAALHLAALRGDAAGVDALLTAGCAVDTPGAEGVTPLVEAVRGRSPRIVARLLGAGANIEGGSSSISPLSAAAQGPRTERRALLTLLVDAGASLAGRGGYRGASPLHQLVADGEVEEAAFLIDRGAALEAKDADGNTPLHLASSRRWSGVVELLLERGAGVNARNAVGETPLLLAFELDNPETEARLVEAGADPAARTDAGWSILHFAAGASRRDGVRYALRLGAEPDARDVQGRTPLHYARYPEVILALLSGGASIDAVDSEGWTPLFRAGWLGEEGAVRTLLDRGARLALPGGSTVMHAFAAHGRPDAVGGALAMGVSVDAEDGTGDRPLHTAASRGGPDGAAMVAALLSHGATLDARGAGGRSPLDAAVVRGDPETVSRLLGAGAAVASRDDAGRTPLFHAVEALATRGAVGPEAEERREVLSHLLRAGADPIAADEQRETPLSVALAAGAVELSLDLCERVPVAGAPLATFAPTLPRDAWDLAVCLFRRGAAPFVPGAIEEAIRSNEGEAVAAYLGQGAPFGPELLDHALDAQAPGAFLVLLRAGASQDPRHLRRLLRRVRHTSLAVYLEEPLRTALREASAGAPPTPSRTDPP